MTNSLTEQKENALKRLMAIGNARRGQLSEQYYTRKTADGRTLRQGPYYVWQRYLKGQKHSVRVPPEQIAQVKADLQRGREVQSIFDELFLLMEQTALQQDQESKKKRRLPKPPEAAKSKRLST